MAISHPDVSMAAVGRRTAQLGWPRAMAVRPLTWFTLISFGAGLAAAVALELLVALLDLVT